MALVDKLPHDFLEHFAAWVRLEPRCRSDNFSQGLQARTADPLWNLSRQWQTRELSAENAASPIRVELTYATQSFGRIRLGETADPADLPPKPMEAVVEQERPELSWRDRVQIGLQFEQFIRVFLAGSGDPKPEDVINAYRMHKDNKDQYVFLLELPGEADWIGIDRASRRFLLLAAGRVVDGLKLLSKVSFEGSDQPNIPLLARITTEQVQEIVRHLKDWCLALDIKPESMRARAWRNQHLDYRFEINKPENDQPIRTHLVAPDYRNGELDWHTFNAASEVRGEWLRHNPLSSKPRRVSIGGSSMRWWAFEDAATDFGDIDVSKPDLARLLLMEFALVYGDDWFVIPLTVDKSTLLRIEKLTVFNVFGESIDINSARKTHPNPLLRFDLFTPSRAQNPDQPGIGDPFGCGDDYLVIPPMAGYREESPAVEEIRFLRDEGANKVWGVEHFVVNGLGRPVDGFDAQRERLDRQRDAKITQIESEIGEIISKLSNDGDLTDNERKELNAQIQAKKDEIATTAC